MTLDGTSGAFSDKDINNLSQPLEISFDRPVNPSVALCLEMTGPAGQVALNQSPYKEMALTFISEFGGKVSGTGTHSIYAYFHNSADAVKAAVKVQQHFYSVNEKKADATRFHARIGIYFGETVANRAMSGDSIGLATKLAAAAGAEQIFVSRSVWESARNFVQVRFEPANAKPVSNTPAGLTAYNVMWEKTAETKPATGVALYFRPLWGLGNNSFPALWEEVVRDVGPFWNQDIKRKVILADNTLCLILWDVKATIPLIQNVFAFLKGKLGEGTGQSFLPVHAFIRTCSLADENSLAGINVELPSEGVGPGDVYVSADAYNFARSRSDMPLVTDKQGTSIPSWHKVAVNRESYKDEARRFLHQEALSGGKEEPCFYCGSRRHKTGACPTKQLLENTGYLGKLGYLSMRELNALFLGFVSVESQDPEKYGRELRDGQAPPSNPAFYAFYELCGVFQLRFFRSIWYTTGDEWGKMTEPRDQPKGGLQWLAQDSLRVSDLVRAESILKEAQLKNPDDYRVYCTMGYLYVEKGDLAEAEYFFKKALKFAKAKASRIFVHFLISRLNRLLNRMETAHRNISDILNIDSRCPEAVYMDILFRLQEKNEKTALQRLAVLVADDRKYYVQAMIDPDMTPFREAVAEQLDLAFLKAREDAQSIVHTADEELERSTFLLRERDLREISDLRSEIEGLLNTDSYFGYLDVVQHSDTLISVCRNAIQEQRKETQRVLDRLDRQVEGDIGFVLDYSFPRLINSYYKKLEIIRDRIKSAREAPVAATPEEFQAQLVMREEVSSELARIEAEFTRLEMLRQTLLNAFRFVRNSIIFMTIVLLVGIFLFPLAANYLSLTSAASDLGLYQRYFIVLGGATSLAASFVLTMRSLYRNDNETAGNMKKAGAAASGGTAPTGKSRQTGKG